MLWEGSWSWRIWVQMLALTPTSWDVGTFGSGDAVLIQGRPRARSAGNIRKKDAAMGKGKKGNEPSEAEDLIPPRPRKPSFPFQWAWESFLVDGRSLATASPNSSHHTSQPKKAQTAGLPPARVPRKSRWKAVPPAAQPVNFPLYWKMEARCRDIRKQLKTWIDPEVCFQEMQEMQDSQDGQEQGQQEDQDGRGEEGPEAKQEFYPSSVLPEKRWKSKKLGTRTKTREEAEGEGQQPPGKSLPITRRMRFWEEIGGEREAEDEVGRASEQSICPPLMTRSREEEMGQLRKWKALHLAGFALLRGFGRKSAKLKDSERLTDLENLLKQLQEEVKELGFYSVQGPVQDVVQPQAEKRQAWEDVKSFLPMGSTTKTFQKRQEATRALMLDWERQQREERARAEQRQAQAHRIRKKLARCLAAYGPSRSKESGASNRKLDELRQQEKQRLAEYKAELQGIHQRVQNRPFLFQQAMQNNARLSVNRRFSQVLSALGLDEDQLLAEALKDDIEEVPPKRRSSKSRKLARIRMEQPL
ncbi:testis-specific protein 10-interacting protein isoform X2 [Monodelphis domestica]|uniref:testis-specific protein 10-interacting protein isoform X2 n=1 Tax=Monodelphis domestica TaxID=13616 RepID=UPI0024E2431D|nr:testis-specific protein 10-interacting protein isoform X2 [Monodelphis domestica]